MTNGPLIIWQNICSFPHMLGSPSSHMTLQLLHSEFLYILEKFYFLFYQCTIWRRRVYVLNLLLVRRYEMAYISNIEFCRLSITCNFKISPKVLFYFISIAEVKVLPCIEKIWIFVLGIAYLVFKIKIPFKREKQHRVNVVLRRFFL